MKKTVFSTELIHIKKDKKSIKNKISKIKQQVI